MEPIDTAVGVIIRDMVLGSGLSQAEISAATGIDKATFSRKMNGQRPWQLREVEALGRYFRTSGSDILYMAERYARTLD